MNCPLPNFVPYVVISQFAIQDLIPLGVLADIRSRFFTLQKEWRAYLARVSAGANLPRITQFKLLATTNAAGGYHDIVHPDIDVVLAEAVPAEGDFVELAIKPGAAERAVVPVACRGDGMHFGAVDPGAQGVVGGLGQEGDFYTVPGVGNVSRPLPPLVHGGCDVIAGRFVGTDDALDFTEAYFVVGAAGQAAQGDKGFVVVTGVHAELTRHVHPRAHVQGVGAAGKWTADHGGVGAAAEVYRLGVAAAAAGFHQGVGAAVGVGAVCLPGDKIIPAARLLAIDAGFEILGEYDFTTAAAGRA